MKGGRPKWRLDGIVKNGIVDEGVLEGVFVLDGEDVGDFANEGGLRLLVTGCNFC